MKYIWINPVTSSMYAPADLNRFLRQQGYVRIETSENYLEIVKEKYKALAEKTEKTILDVRCPAVLPLMEAYHLSSAITIPPIEPILIHCGREISRRESLRGHQKIITTPCYALADMGNALELPETRFIPWNRFLESTDSPPNPLPLGESPIPPGFFSDLGIAFSSVTGEAEIHNYFKHYRPGETALVEMLFCKDGCHNGDGLQNTAKAVEREERK